MDKETELYCSVNHNYREGYQKGRQDMKLELCNELMTELNEMMQDLNLDMHFRNGVRTCYWKLLERKEAAVD